jgi:hypothetical protein
VTISWSGDSLRLPFVPANELKLVADERTCRKANQAYQAELQNTGGSGFSGRVYVVRVGTSYAVLDPALRYGAEYGAPDFWTVLITDSNFKPLAIF